MSVRRLTTTPRGTESGADVLAPTVGWWIDPPAAGAIVGPGSRIGTLRRLGRRFELYLDAGPVGRVDDGPANRQVPVAHGDLLFRIVRVATDAATGADAAVGQAAEAGLGEGTHVVVAPSQGVFYRRPSPDAPAFVDVGATLDTGQPIGLVEVMKTFNQIVYGGAGLPDRATVVAIRCEDGAEVDAGETLMVVRAC